MATTRSNQNEKERVLIPLGDRVRECRLKLGLTQAEVDARMGLTGKYVGGIERGVRNIGFINLVRLAKALEVPPSDLL